ncbi:MAG: arabinan endo-1,5-alpha-L-arabinosidase [Anaerolineae bacterium]
MSHQFTRRQFLRSGLTVAGGIALTLPSLARMQDANSTPQAVQRGNPVELDLSGDITQVHDPAIIKADGAYYVFCTGIGVPIRKSTDLLTWERPKPGKAIQQLPNWVRKAMPNIFDQWAPDISFYNNKYHLYYAVSTFGSNRSVIGLMTNISLDGVNPAYQWVDEGLVIESVSTNNYNCIDPNLIIDAEGVPWLAFGSFWSGIKMRRLDYNTGKLSDEDTTLYSLAQRFENNGSVEAPFIIRHHDYYYLFASFDQCCQGAASTYRVMVGRSDSITGPYLDRDGVELLKGGGTQVTFPTDRWRGPGHNSILHDDDKDYIVYHAYDAPLAGIPTLHIDPLEWDSEGWPFIPTTT